MTSGSREGRRYAPASVLIVDDHDHSRSAARLVLEDAGFAIIEARTGCEALLLAQITRPRVMLVDIVLPEIDGLELTRLLRADPALRRCAVIAFTAFSGGDYRDAAFAAGCNEFVTKPVAAPHLVSLVRLYARRGALPLNEIDPLNAVGPIHDERTLPVAALRSLAKTDVPPSTAS